MIKNQLTHPEINVLQFEAFVVSIYMIIGRLVNGHCSGQDHKGCETLARPKDLAL